MERYHRRRNLLASKREELKDTNQVCAGFSDLCKEPTKRGAECTRVHEHRSKEESETEIRKDKQEVK